MMKLFATPLILGFAVLQSPQALAQSTSNCITKQSEEEYQACIERNSTKRKVDPQIWGAGNSSATMPEPLEEDITDSLPPSSASHVRSEMVKKVYTQVGEWTPEARNQEFDFEPSEAAQGNAKLSAEEEAAFAAAVSDYHDREQAAYREREDTTTVAGKVNAGSAQDGDTAEEGQARSALDILGDLNVLGSGQAGSDTTAADEAAPGGTKVVDGDVTIGGQAGSAEGQDGAQSSAQRSAADLAAQIGSAGDATDAQSPARQTTAEQNTGQQTTGQQSGTTAQSQSSTPTSEPSQASKEAQGGAARSAADLAGQISNTNQDNTQQAEAAAEAIGSQAGTAMPSGQSSPSSEDPEQIPTFDDTKGGTQRSAADLAAQISNTDQANTAQSNTQQTSTAEQPQQAQGSSGQSAAPTRPIPPADPISAALLANLFADTTETLEASPSPAPLQPWSDPDAGTVDQAAIETATQAILAQEEAKEDAPASAQAPLAAVTNDPAAALRAAQKDQARLALLGGADIQASPPEETLPLETAARLLTLSLP